MRQTINSFFWLSKEKKKTTGQTQGFDLKRVWIFFQGMVPFLSGVHMWILNGKSNQLLRWSSILHTCSMPRLGAVCERVWWPLVVAYEKEGWKFRDTADLLRLPQADDPHWHAPTSRMQTTSELSDFGFQLLGRAVSDRRVVPSCLVSAVLREREHRDIAQSGEAALNLEGFICMLDAWSLRIKSPQKSQALLTLVMPAGAHVPPARELLGCCPWLGRQGRQFCT